MALLQGEIKFAAKNKKGYGYNYAPLDECLKILAPLLNKFKLALFQPLVMIEGKMFIETILTHESGEFIKSVIPISSEGSGKMNEMQKLGSSITYARRYSLAIIGVFATEEDTDGTGESFESGKIKTLEAELLQANKKYEAAVQKGKDLREEFENYKHEVESGTR